MAMMEAFISQYGADSLLKLSLYGALISVATVLFHSKILEGHGANNTPIRAGAPQSALITMDALALATRTAKAVIVFAIMVNVGWFFIRVGDFSEQGLPGMFDPVMMKLIWSSSVGDLVALRIVALFIGLFSLISIAHGGSTYQIIGRTGMAISFTMLLISFAVTGHVSTLAYFNQLLLVVHVGVMAWWFSALLPLYLANNYKEKMALRDVLVSFGERAIPWVFLLLLTGSLMAVSLITDFASLIITPYGLRDPHFYLPRPNMYES